MWKGWCSFTLDDRSNTIYLVCECYVVEAKSAQNEIGNWKPRNLILHENVFVLKISFPCMNLFEAIQLKPIHVPKFRLKSFSNKLCDKYVVKSGTILLADPGGRRQRPAEAPYKIRNRLGSRSPFLWGGRPPYGKSWI